MQPHKPTRAELAAAPPDTVFFDQPVPGDQVFLAWPALERVPEHIERPSSNITTRVGEARAPQRHRGHRDSQTVSLLCAPCVSVVKGILLEY